jgi:hypothetical protein
MVVRDVRDGEPDHRAGAGGRRGVVTRAAGALKTLSASAHSEQPQARASYLALLHLRECVKKRAQLPIADAHTFIGGNRSKSEVKNGSIVYYCGLMLALSYLYR